MNDRKTLDGVDDAALGLTLKRLISTREVPVYKIARAIGASRQTVYNWMRGGRVFCAYRPHVRAVIKILQASKTKDEAWSKICQEFVLTD